MQIGSMYVASKKDGLGCAGNGTKTWLAAIEWANGLSWLGKDDWRMPAGGAGGELSTICNDKDHLGSYQLGNYWSSTEYGADRASYVDFSNCSLHGDYKTRSSYVRAVRASE